MEDATDIRTLIGRAQDGDDEAFEALFNSYYAPMYRYVYARVRDAAAAEDIVQDVFIRVHMSLSSFQLTDASPLAYWYTIARNAIIDYRRKKKTVPIDDLELSQIPDEEPTSEKEQIRRQDIAQVRLSFELLSDEQQEVLALRFSHELPHRTISSIIGKTEAAVRQIQSRAIRELRSIYESKYGTSI